MKKSLKEPIVLPLALITHSNAKMPALLLTMESDSNALETATPLGTDAPEDAEKLNEKNEYLFYSFYSLRKMVIFNGNKFLYAKYGF